MSLFQWHMSVPGAYPGQHQTIITRELWEAVHAIIDKRKMGPRARHTENPALLAGLLYAPNGQWMLPTFTQKKNGKLVERVQLHEEGLDILWKDDGWQQFRRELEPHPFVAEQRDLATAVDALEMA